MGLITKKIELLKNVSILIEKNRHEQAGHRIAKFVKGLRSNDEHTELIEVMGQYLAFGGDRESIKKVILSASKKMKLGKHSTGHTMESIFDVMFGGEMRESVNKLLESVEEMVKSDSGDTEEKKKKPIRRKAKKDD